MVKAPLLAQLGSLEGPPFQQDLQMSECSLQPVRTTDVIVRPRIASVHVV